MLLHGEMKMIKCEVVFDEDKVLINDGEFIVKIEVTMCDVYNQVVGYLDSFDTLEEAIKYCMEN